MLEEKYSEAASVMEPLVALGNVALGFGLNINAVRTDLALSWLLCGQTEKAKAMFSTIDLASLDQLDLDSRIIFLTNYIRLASELSAPFDSDSLERVLGVANVQWADRSKSLIMRLDELVPGLRMA